MAKVAEFVAFQFTLGIRLPQCPYRFLWNKIKYAGVKNSSIDFAQTILGLYN